ncbi:SDR family oxidoreductase [Streptomyces sp. PSKA30]|uniref:SDR family oxidoreductase n=1 Tax=Streptomyces sp. PSKA30 TaxID=2874597 RepID=UPI001CD0AFDB|nr:SDR family oxidoreductase [Streptomyces sp. PSKA30]MBZ9645910.1 SDR family oxidoreductase [Streptomyces sp. PSKA30]
MPGRRERGTGLRGAQPGPAPGPQRDHGERRRRAATGGSPLRDSGRPANTHLYEPEAFTPHPVTAQDIAETAAFLLDARSGYVTGQVLYVCGGKSLYAQPACA